jgi:hypothetical protein
MTGAIASRRFLAAAWEAVFDAFPDGALATAFFVTAPFPALFLTGAFFAALTAGFLAVSVFFALAAVFFFAMVFFFATGIFASSRR